MWTSIRRSGMLIVLLSCALAAPVRANEALELLAALAAPGLIIAVVTDYPQRRDESKKYASEVREMGGRCQAMLETSGADILGELSTGLARTRGSLTGYAEAYNEALRAEGQCRDPHGLVARGARYVAEVDWHKRLCLDLLALKDCYRRHMLVKAEALRGAGFEARWRETPYALESETIRIVASPRAP
ncbi:MAG: hypothetical protein HY077_04315 [Elusimicrobia bacterium]|nr:hypothetical protein [Elusimicrobiota bacterium]